MFNAKPGLLQLLERTNIVHFDRLLSDVKEKYQFAEIQEYQPILEGYENANIKLFTDKGTFVMKIFSKEVTRMEAEEYIKVTGESLKIGVPFPQLLLGEDGYLEEYQEESSAIFYFLMDFFEGNNFEQQEVKMADIENVTRYLAHFNTLMIPVEEIYDSWGSKNFVHEYSKNKEKIPENIKSLLTPIVNEISGINFSKFSSSIIHGDMQRKHILKNKNAEYCILDLGCMRNDARVYDLSIHLAWFCLAEDTWDKREEIAKAVIGIYTKIHHLSPEEFASLPILVKASYAAYMLRSSCLIQDGDTTHETKAWFEKSKRMLELMNSWEWEI